MVPDDIAGPTDTENDAWAPPADAVNVTKVEEETDLAVAVNDALELPAGTLSVDCTVSAPLLELVNETAVPPDGAVPLRVTVQAELPPEDSAEGVQISPLTWTTGAAFTSSAAVLEAPLSVTVIVTGVVVETTPATAEKTALLLPAGIVTEAGVETDALLFEIVTLAPPAGAAAFKLTEQALLPPDVTVDGLHVRALRDGSEMELITPPVAGTVTAAPAAEAPEAPVT